VYRRVGQCYDAVATGYRTPCCYCYRCRRGLSVSDDETPARRVSASVQPNVAHAALHTDVVHRKQRGRKQRYDVVEVDAQDCVHVRFHVRLHWLYVRALLRIIATPACLPASCSLIKINCLVTAVDVGITCKSDQAAAMHQYTICC